MSILFSHLPSSAPLNRSAKGLSPASDGPLAGDLFPLTAYGMAEDAAAYDVTPELYTATSTLSSATASSVGTPLRSAAAVRPSSDPSSLSHSAPDAEPQPQPHPDGLRHVDQRLLPWVESDTSESAFASGSDRDSPIPGDEGVAEPAPDPTAPAIGPGARLPSDAEPPVLGADEAAAKIQRAWHAFVAQHPLSAIAPWQPRAAAPPRTHRWLRTRPLRRPIPRSVVPCGDFRVRQKPGPGCSRLFDRRGRAVPPQDPPAPGARAPMSTRQTLQLRPVRCLRRATQQRRARLRCPRMRTFRFAAAEAEHGSAAAPGTRSAAGPFPGGPTRGCGAIVSRALVSYLLYHYETLRGTSADTRSSASAPNRSWASPAASALSPSTAPAPHAASAPTSPMLPAKPPTPAIQRPSSAAPPATPGRPRPSTRLSSAALRRRWVPPPVHVRVWGPPHALPVPPRFPARHCRGPAHAAHLVLYAAPRMLMRHWLEGDSNTAICRPACITIQCAVRSWLARRRVRQRRVRLSQVRLGISAAGSGGCAFGVGWGDGVTRGVTQAHRRAFTEVGFFGVGQRGHM